jgi:serine/threonine protein kinase
VPFVDRGQVAAALPAYELGARLGVGAFGLVLAGRHRRLNRDVAIKVLSVTYEEAEEASARFVAEARILAGIDHPHVVRVYDYVEDDDLCLIVMELLAGGTLTRRRRGMSAEDACAVGLAVAEALTCAHGQGVLHRDIKSDNILFNGDGLLKVTDFGIAKIFAGSAATASAIVGTPKYMAPEQLTGGRLGPATDLYALGMILYELLAGAPPFDPALPPHALYHHHVYVPPPPMPGVPAGVAEVVLRTVEKDPTARYPSAREFALALADAATDSYGPRWTTRSGIPLRLSDEVRNAVERLPDLTSLVPAPTRAPPSTMQAEATTLAPAEDTLAHHRRTFGDDHPDTLTAALALARRLYELGEYQAARALAEDTLTRRRRTLGDDHPDTLASAHILARCLGMLGEHHVARAIAEDTLARRRRLLGDDHPDTLASAHSLAWRLYELGEYRAVRELGEDTLSRRRRLLGEDHPDSLWSADNLAWCLGELGEFQAARALAEDTLARRRRLLGEDHPDTLASADSLAWCLSALGE